MIFKGLSMKQTTQFFGSWKSDLIVYVRVEHLVCCGLDLTTYIYMYIERYIDKDIDIGYSNKNWKHYFLKDILPTAFMNLSYPHLTSLVTYKL